MRMEADHNLNLHNGGVFPPSLSNQNVVSFQPVAIGLVSEGMYNSGEISTMAGMILPGNPGTQSHTASVIPLPGNLSGNIILDPMPPVKQSAAVATHWSLEELYVLRQGLTEYATEPTNIMKYIKIAAKLPEKTVRDVAMKCQLMAKEESGKRRRLENYHAEKKEKIVYTSSLNTMHSLQPESVATFSLRVHDVPSNNQLCQASLINFETQHLLMENFNLLNQIGSNLELKSSVDSSNTSKEDSDRLSENILFSITSSHSGTFQVQDNIALFYRTRENITNILTSMSVNPGIMSQMPSLPVLIDDHLFQSILPLAAQVHLPANTSLKDEPRYW